MPKDENIAEQHDSGEQLPFVLRSPCVDDVPLYFQYLQNPDVTIWLEDECQLPLTYQQVERFVLAPVWYRRAIECNGAFVGMTGLEIPDLSRQVARFFIVIGDPSLWGKGLGESVLRAIVMEGFNHLGLRKIISNYLEPNTASAVIHKRVGFHVDGCLRKDTWRHNEWVDQILLSLLRDEFDV